MSRTPSVSVVMNVHNGQAYLREALTSVLTQSFDDLEIVVWNDRSTDGSEGIVASFEDPRVRYFLAPEKTSLGRARELAIGRTRGEWIAFLDQDDLWLPDKLESQLRRAEVRSESALVYGRALAFDEAGREADFDHRHELRPLPEGNIFRELFADSCFIAMSSVMFHRDALEAVLPIPTAIQVVPDYYLYLAVTRHGSAAAVQEVVCRYRLHSSSMTHHQRLRMHEEALGLIERWKSAIPSRLARRRQRIHQTLVALEKFRDRRTFAGALPRLLTRGSLGFLLSRPPVRLVRALRRRVFRPRHPLVSSRNESIPRAGVVETAVSATGFEAAVEFLSRRVARRDKGYVSPANVYSVMLARERSTYRESLSRASLVTPDGMPIVWALRAMGHVAERVHNDDLALACCERFENWRHFLVGGRAGQAAAVAAVLRSRFPGITIVGHHPTPLRPVPPSESELIIEAIQRADTSIVWVGMGTPWQDEWMASVAARVEAPMVGVGSLFDLLSGVSRPAPAWVKQSGLQWLHRLLQEPRRLGLRYLYYNPRFVFLLTRQLARRYWLRPPSTCSEKERLT